MPLWFSTAMVSHISVIVVELSAYPDRFRGASLGAVMERRDSQLLFHEYHGFGYSQPLTPILVVFVYKTNEALC